MIQTRAATKTPPVSRRGELSRGVAVSGRSAPVEGSLGLAAHIMWRRWCRICRRLCILIRIPVPIDLPRIPGVPILALEDAPFCIASPMPVWPAPLCACAPASPINALTPAAATPISNFFMENPI